LGFLILVHEFGHFIVAKLTGMRVEEFSIGFGRYLVSRRIGETVYGISILPLGGYVRVTGMHEEEFQARVAAVEGRGEKIKDTEQRLTGATAVSDEEIVATPLHRRYYAKPVWQRIIFIVAGVSMNVVAAFVLLYVVAALQGYYQPSTTLEEVVEGSPAAEAGLRPGDRLVSVDGAPAAEWPEVQESIRANTGEEIAVVVERDGVRRELPVVVGDREGTGYLGIAPAVEHIEPGVVESVGVAFDRTYGLFALTFRALTDMFRGDAPVTGEEGLAGPVGIVSISSEAVRGGYFLSLLAFISVQLAILNMIPLLPLDGGHVLFSLIEKLLGRAVPLRTFESISMVGIALFLLLAIVATSNDFGRLFSG
jgi:regulator of sigma E protease